MADKALHPPVGAFLRPVGWLYAYCYRVLSVRPAINDDATVIWDLERWGMTEERTPVRDGHQHMCWLRDLRQVLPGVWRIPRAPIWGEPLYYRLMDSGPAVEKPQDTADPIGTSCAQLALF